MEIMKSKAFLVEYSPMQEDAGETERAGQGVEDLDITPRLPEAVQLLALDRSNIEYVPAEYFRGVQAAQLIQSGQYFILHSL